MFEEVGREVCWQDLGEGFDHNRFRFQVFDEADWADRDWQNQVRETLERYGKAAGTTAADTPKV